MEIGSEEIVCAMAVQKVMFYHIAEASRLYKRLGSAKAIAEHCDEIKSIMPDMSARQCQALSTVPEILDECRREYEWCRQKNISILHIADDRYPQRLRQTFDAPLVLFFIGNANLNEHRVINIVGTRKCTLYGQDLIRRFITDLKALCPRTLIVSGLAFGVDINAHRNALENGFSTVGVLAHGLDQIYPSQHRETARQMLSQGGLLTEYPSHTNADKKNFIRRNRIVAGMCDATILVESAAHGGGLITTRLAQDYGRDVFAFPGAVGNPYSVGCNNLIRKSEAMLITSAEDFVESMGWTDDKTLSEAQEAGIERQLFVDLSDDEQKIVNALKEENDMQANVIATKLGMEISKVSASLFSLELNGMIKNVAGNIYHLL